MKKILLVEDEAHVVSFIKKGLSEEGFEVSVTFDGKSGLQLIQQNDFDLVILDIMIPEMNGLEVCAEVRKTNTTIPILFLTALGTAENIVLGLEKGGDDYLVKPFKFIELVARVKNLLKRNNKNSKKGIEDDSSEIYKIDDLIVNDATKTVRRDGKEISLTSTEYRLLLHLLKNKKRVLSRNNLLESVWGVDFDLGTNVVDVYVNYLRKKIDNSFDRKLIHTVIGMGYVLKDE